MGLGGRFRCGFTKPFNRPLTSVARCWPPGGAGRLGVHGLSSAKQELEALWRAVFGEPPSINADPAMLSEILVRHLPRAPPYIDGEDAAAGERSAGRRVARRTSPSKRR
jgi:hypothetical protein